MRAIFLGLLLALPASLWAADKAQTLNVKPGLWEITMTTTTSGETPIPAELLAKLTPEQRARMEQRMKDSSGEKTRTMTDKNCVTKEQIDTGLAFGHEPGKCSNTTVSSTSSMIEVRVECADNGMNTSGTMHFDAPNPESIKGSSQMSLTGGGRTRNVHVSVTGKWLGPVCSKTE